jgi:hypothetical protein
MKALGLLVMLALMHDYCCLLPHDLDRHIPETILILIVRNWQISPKILKLLEMRHENASSSSLSNRDSASGGA